MFLPRPVDYAFPAKREQSQLSARSSHRLGIDAVSSQRFVAKWRLQ
jgi:hypothetical protein